MDYPAIDYAYSLAEMEDFDHLESDEIHFTKPEKDSNHVNSAKQIR